MFTHGQAEFLTPKHDGFAGIEEHLVRHYGSSPSSWGDEIVYLRVRPTWMVPYAYDAASLVEQESE